MADVGRPTIMTPDIIAKLEEVFALGGSDLEACFYAGIGKSTLYNYQERYPEFVDRKEALRERPVLLSRKTVVKALETDSRLAFDYLTKKKPNEFATRQEITGKDGDNLIPKPIIDLTNVSTNNSNKESNITSEENTDNTGGIISEQNDKHSTILDSLIPE